MWAINYNTKEPDQKPVRRKISVSEQSQQRLQLNTTSRSLKQNYREVRQSIVRNMKRREKEIKENPEEANAAQEQRRAETSFDASLIQIPQGVQTC